MANLIAPGISLPSVDGYTIEDYVGEGGMGVVYRAREHGTNQVVALKMLSRTDAAGVYRFKREFRTLANIVHPNLVRLVDLCATGEHWFFTMELISGWGFFEYLGVVRHDEELPPSSHTERDLSRADAPVSSGLRRLPVRTPPVDDAPGHPILRDAFGQLVAGISALHATGKLHCDIKPSNVVVDEDGRVVVLDFGVSRAFASEDPFRTLDELAGTPEYMSPEQASGDELGPASDWYAVGVVLYEALCGRLPFSGSRRALVEEKRQLPRRPSDYDPAVPEDLEALCMDLLHPAAAQRPSGAAILERLAPPFAIERPAFVSAHRETQSSLVGRLGELASLREAVPRVSTTGPVVVLLTGSSGIGKSTLLQHFCTDMSARAGALVLQGRCFERETVPYKALDPIIDELARLLRRMSDRDVLALLPRHIGALTRVFPVLRRVRAIAQASHGALDLPVLESRRRAGVALRELLGRLADRRRLIVVIDDLQWGDLDSARMLLDILEAPDPPALSLVLGARDESSGPFLAELMGSSSEGSFRASVRRVALGELSIPEATELALQLLGESFPAPWARAIAEESRGHPYFVRELVLHAQLSSRADALPTGSSPLPPRLEPILKARIDNLPARERAQLELIAVASYPVSLRVVRQVADDGYLETSDLTPLARAQLVRRVGRSNDPQFECYHDRVRAVVLAELTGENGARCHRALAAGLEKIGDADPEMLLEHHLGSGELARAQEHVVGSARAAAEALAFSRAARLFRLALEIVPASRWSELDLQRSLANALANEGRLADAAEAYELAAQQASGLDAIELRRQAAQHFLTSGHSERGLKLLRQLLADVGIEYPETPATAVVRLGLERLKLRAFGLGFKERDASQVPARQLVATDVCFSAAVGLSMTDLIRTAAFSALQLRLALKTGEPMRIARALAFEMGVAPGAGQEGLRWAHRALPVAERLSARQGSAYHHGLFFLAQGHVAYLSGQWKGALDWLTRAEASLRDSRTSDVHWALLASTVLANISAAAAGELQTVAAGLPSLAKEARQRSDLFSLALTAYPRMILDLATDQPDLAARNLSDLELPQGGADLRSFTALHCRLVLDRYVGDSARAWQRLLEHWPALERSKLLAVNIVRVSALAERGSAALAMVSSTSDASVLRIGKDCARKLANEPLPHARALGLLLDARIRLLAGDQPKALAILTDAALQLEAAGLALVAQCTRRSMGRLMGGHMGDIIVGETDANLRRLGVRAPARFANMMAPGFDRRLVDGEPSTADSER